MIIYMSGTGNTAHCARVLGERLREEIVDMTPKIRAGDFSPVESARLIVLTPTYCWRMPRIVEEYLRQIDIRAERIYFILTCGSGIGAASKYAEALAREKKVAFGGLTGVVMPENYTALFSPPPQEEARAIIGRAEERIDEIASAIEAGSAIGDAPTWKGRLLSGMAPLFDACIVTARPFRVKDSCIGCGECARRCMTANIEMKAQRPLWHDRCIHCMACINYCPVEAIEYGRRTAGKVRYTFESVEKEARPTPKKDAEN
ncbi:ferredoxin [Peptoniphilus ivorii]|uniref:EFR1 family ferrodoxin n=1 Tax=Aedoeadaptatus ivorii TaxID=54006 RepID=UPI002786F3C2|nr:EFR1 family ferrodoxin [Peptoniphilus ivorii]MDQ0508730.1 ferredoxin [Peptoniphilus ivorii]